jgi:sodium/potassium/calcium exchanger 6
VVGVVSILIPFKLTRRPFLRDVTCYLVAATWSYVALWDGAIELWESVGFVGVYVLYVLVVIVGRYLYQKWKRTNVDRLAIKRKVSKTEEMLPVPRPAVAHVAAGMGGDHGIAAALDMSEGFAVASATAMGGDLGSDNTMRRIERARHPADKAEAAAAGGGGGRADESYGHDDSRYEDEDESGGNAGSDSELLEDESDDPLLGGVCALP